MRYALQPVVLCVGLMTLVARAQVAPPEEKAFLEKNIDKLVKLDPAPVTGDALEKVFDAKFYMVKVTAGAGGEATTLVAARVGDNLSDVSMPIAAADLPALKALVKPDF